MTEKEVNSVRAYVYELKDEINRQKAEIKKLKEASEEAVSCFHRMESLYNIKCMELKVAKAEAVKEFAERLHCHCQSIINEEWNKKVYPTSWADAYEEFDDVVDNLVKEMAGDNNGK